MPRSKEKLYHVEVITSARRLNAPTSTIEQADRNGQVPRRGRSRKSKWEYLVKWAGYGSDADSWEPERNFRRGCEYLLSSFWKHSPIGKHDDVTPGCQINANEKWIEKETKRFRLWQKLNRKVQKKRDKNVYDRLSEVGEGDLSQYSASTVSPANSPTSSDAPTISDADDSDSDNAPSVSKRKLDTTIDVSDEQRPLVITIPPQKKVKPNSSASVETEEVELNEVSVPDFSREDPQLSEQQNVAITPEEPASVLSVPEPKSPQIAPESPRPSHDSLPAASPNTPTLTKPQDLQPLDSGVRDVLVESTLESVPPGSGISTKQRLSSGALALRPPKAISDTLPGSKNQVPPPKAPYTSFMPLSFKKGTVPTSSMALCGYPELQEPTLSSINALPSPYVQNDHDDESLQDQVMQDHNTHMEAGDEFLEELMLSSFTNLNDLNRPPEECPIEPLHPQLPIPERPSTSKLPPEPWTWSGDVFTDTEPSKPVFGVTINAVTPVEGSLSFSEALVGIEHLYFISFHDAVDFDSVLPACREIHQFARLNPRTSADVEHFDLFCTYMAKMHKILLLPVFLNNHIIGHTIFFHPDTVPVSSRLQPPLEIHEGKGLAAALVPWTLSKYQLSKYDRNPPSRYLPTEIYMEPLLKDKSLWLRSIKTKPRYHHGLRVLKFPRMLHNYLCEDEYERTYSVWYEGGDGTKKRPGMETLALFGVLDKCGIKRSRIQDARMVFIHVGAIKSLHKLPGFVDICSISSSVSLYTYGSHETIASEIWGVREVYPCGGIVTFTPQALLDDFPGVIHRIRQIHRHPLWECYIIPSALGMAVTLYSLREGNDPISDFDSGKHPYTTLLTAIEDGELSLISSPSNHDSSSKKDVDPCQEWLEKYWTHRPSDSRATFKACLDTFNDRYRGSLPTLWTPGILDEISKDLRCMRTQRVFMEKYRRYVVLDSPRAHQKTREDALEWTSTTKFDFKDDFFPTQE